MTIESGGLEYSFQGHLVSTEMQVDTHEVPSLNDWQEFRREPHRVNITLEIAASSPVIRKQVQEVVEKEVRRARTNRR